MSCVAATPPVVPLIWSSIASPRRNFFCSVNVTWCSAAS